MVGKLCEFCASADSSPFQPAAHLNYAKTRQADAFLFIHYQLWLDRSGRAGQASLVGVGVESIVVRLNRCFWGGKFVNSACGLILASF